MDVDPGSSVLDTLPGLEGYRQFESERGWVITNDSTEAHRIIVAVRTTAVKFERIFGKPVFRGARDPVGTPWSRAISKIPRSSSR